MNLPTVMFNLTTLENILEISFLRYYFDTFTIKNKSFLAKKLKKLHTFTKTFPIVKVPFTENFPLVKVPKKESSYLLLFGGKIDFYRYSQQSSIQLYALL